jgi:hypothetical protein
MRAYSVDLRRKIAKEDAEIIEDWEPYLSATRKIALRI